jgi:hypothetical protein
VGKKIIWGVLVAAVAALVAAFAHMIWMPGASHRGALPPLTAEDAAAAQRMRRDVAVLARVIGERRVGLDQTLARTADHLFVQLEALGASGNPSREALGATGHHAENLVLELPGASRDGLVVVGAHYDSAEGTPGANDNGSGVAAALELARRFARTKLARPLRFVLFANEEPPFFEGPAMGSVAHAAASKRRGDEIRVMFSLETMGYYSDQPGSQRYPWPLSLAYPDTGNFIAFVGNVASASTVRSVVESFRKHARFPSEAAALPESIPGVGWSDHASFWPYGVPAIMVTDTAPFRYPHYHTAEDLPEHIDFERLARVVTGLERVLRDLVVR